MKSKEYLYGYNYHRKFSDLQLEWLRGFEKIFFTDDNGKYYLIYVGSAICDFAIAVSDPEDDIEEVKLLNYIEIIEFDKFEERQHYRESNYPFDVLSRNAMDKDKTKKS